MLPERQRSGQDTVSAKARSEAAAFGLTDSPAGLAAWIVETLRAWSGCEGDVEQQVAVSPEGQSPAGRDADRVLAERVFPGDSRIDGRDEAPARADRLGPDRRYP